MALIQSAAKMYAEIINYRIKQQAKAFAGPTQCGVLSVEDQHQMLYFLWTE